MPEGLSPAFASDAAKQRQRAAFAVNLSSPAPDLQQPVEELSAKFVALPDIRRAQAARPCQRSQPGPGRAFCIGIRSRPGNSLCGCFSGGLYRTPGNQRA